MIYLCQADPKLRLPNLALMRLATYFRGLGRDVTLLRSPDDYVPGFDDPPTAVYGSAIFSTSEPYMRAFENALGAVTWGGTGVRVDSSLDEIDPLWNWDLIQPAYSIYPRCTCSVGFLTRGCGMRCPFCVVPTKEGRPSVASSIARIWRGGNHPKHLELLDNDAFAKSLRQFWRDAVREFRDGGYKVCFSQGINLRLVDDESAELIAATPYYGHDFKKSRKLYTAWDNLGDQHVFERGVARLEKAGVSPKRLTVYMLIGYDPAETWEMILFRFRRLRELGCEPYPMPYEKWKRPDLAHFERYVKRHVWRKAAFSEYDRLPDDLRARIQAAEKRIADGWSPTRLRVVS